MSGDERLRDLERRVFAACDPSEILALRAELRLELLRLGRAEEAGFEPGDVIEFTESDGGKWTCQIQSRLSPSKEYLGRLRVVRPSGLRP